MQDNQKNCIYNDLFSKYYLVFKKLLKKCLTSPMECVILVIMKQKLPLNSTVSERQVLMAAEDICRKECDDLSVCTDEELVVKCRADDHSAVYASELICRYFPFIKMKAAQMCAAVCLGSCREDLAEEGLLGVMNAVRGFDPGRGAEFSAYAHVCIVNRMKTAAARLSRQNAQEISSEEEQGQSRVTPENIFFGRELMKDICGELTDMEYRAFRLFYSGLSAGEIADEMGIAPKSADNALQRARKKLRNMLSEK